MQFYRLDTLLRTSVLAVFSIVLISCGSGDGEDSVDASIADVSSSAFRLVFEDDFGGPAQAAAGRPGRGVAARRSAAPEVGLPLGVGNWRVDQGYGPNGSGWGNDEWQLYQNSMIDNLRQGNGVLVVRANCAVSGGLYTETAATQTIPYARIIDAGVDFGGNPTPSDPNSSAVRPLDGRTVLAIDFQDAGRGFGGAIFELDSAQDISDFEMLRFAIDTSAVPDYADLVVQLEDGVSSPSVFLSNYVPVFVEDGSNGTRSVYEIPLADFGGIDIANVTLVGFWNLSSTQGAVNLTFGTIYLDDIRFTRTCGSGDAGKRDGTITSGKVITKDRLNVRGGRIQARIKMPSGAGMWPAFWTLGSDIDQRPWPDAGEIDIVEMHYFFSDKYTTHFTTHWSGPEYDPASRPVCASGVRSSLFADEEENCKTASKTFDDPLVALTDDFHIYEVEWSDRQIVGKIDGITYFTQGIDAATMEEFLKDHYLILNVAVGGTLGGPFGPSMSKSDWLDPAQTDMLVDWVRVYEQVPPTGATLIDESGRNLPYNRIINSAEFDGAFVETELESKAVKPLVGDEVMEVTYSTTRSENGGGVPAAFSGSIFWFNNLDVSDFRKFVFSIDFSRFPNFADIGVEFTDSRNNSVLVRTSDYVPDINGNWHTFEIPLADFAGVDPNDIVFIGFFNPFDAGDTLIGGTLFFDDIRFVAEACSASPTVAFDAGEYNPATSVGQVTVNDPCAAGKLVTVQLDNGLDEIYVGVKLDAAGVGQALFGMVDPLSVCPTDDSQGYIALERPSLLASYKTASATVMVEDTAGATTLEGDRLFFYATDPDQALAFIPDAPVANSFNYSVFDSDSELDGSFPDATYDPVFQVRSGTGYGAEVAQIALINLRAGFAANAESFNFKFKNVGSPNDAVKVEFGVLGVSASAVTINLAGDSRSELDPDDPTDTWYRISIPMSDFGNAANFDFIAITSADPAPASGNPFYFLITDINLQESIDVVPAACDAQIGEVASAVPVDFEDAGAPYTFSDFEGGSAVVIDNPQSGGINTSAKVAQMVKDGGQSFGGSTLALDAPVDFSSLESFTMKVWASRPVPVLFKLEGSISTAQVEVGHCGSGSWEELTFDFAGLTGGLGDVTGITLIFDNGTVGDATNFPADWTFYFDDIDLAAGSPPVPCPEAMPVDFEDAGAPYSFSDFEGGSAVVIDNPQSGGINTSAKVGQMVKDGGQAFGGSTLALDAAVDFSSLETFVMKVWASRAVPVTFKLEGSVADMEVVASHSGSSSWEELVFDFTGMTSSLGDVAAITLIFDNGIIGDATNFPNDWTFYFDDIDLSAGGGGSGGELLTNGDFESSPTDKAPWINAGGVATNNFYQADVTNPDPGQPFLVNLSQVLPITPDETYVLSFRARASVDRSMIAGIGLNGGPSGCCDFRSNTEIVALTTEWQTFSYTLQAVDDNGGGPFGDSVSRVLFDMNAEAGSVFIDDVSLTVQAASGGGNLLPNGGFETGDTTNWNVLDVGPTTGAVANVTSAFASEGTQSIRVQTTELQALLLEQVNVQAGNVADGATVDIAFDLRGDFADGGEVQTSLSWAGATTGVIGPNISTTVASFQEFTYSPTVTGGDLTNGFNLQIKVVCGGAATCNADVYIDNIRVAVTNP